MKPRPVRKTDWKTEAMPESSGSAAMDMAYNAEAFERIRLGIYPRQMEDKWFIYYEEPWLHLHRSWTGCLIFSIRFERSGKGGRAVEVRVNQDPQQYRAGELADEARKAESLVNMLLAFNVPGGGQAPGGDLEGGDEAALSLWSEVGQAMLGGGPTPGYPTEGESDEDSEADGGAAAATPESRARSSLEVLPCLDSDEMALARRRELDIPGGRAAALGRSAVEAATTGCYLDEAGRTVEWGHLVESARTAKVSIPPDASLPTPGGELFARTRVQVSNETTLAAARRLVEDGLAPVALNFANGVHPGGGFLGGARAQEEVLCRSSALYATLEGDPMYAEHARRPQPDSTDWAIYSPDVPVFRADDGRVLARPWLLGVITCAAPFAPAIGQPAAGDLLHKRIRRVLAIARAYEHSALVLGAWGCGAFRNDPLRTARDFRRALEGEFSGAFSDVVFAITDWSPERRFLGPFRKVFGEA
jgi:uncharacterized protein (TIGR02452 family)